MHQHFHRYRDNYGRLWGERQPVNSQTIQNMWDRLGLQR